MEKKTIKNSKNIKVTQIKSSIGKNSIQKKHLDLILNKKLNKRYSNILKNIIANLDTNKDAFHSLSKKFRFNFLS